MSEELKASDYLPDGVKMSILLGKGKFQYSVSKLKELQEVYENAYNEFKKELEKQYEIYAGKD